MAKCTYEKDGKTYWKVYVNLRSKTDSTIRVQKVVPDLESESAADAVERKLLRKLAEEVARLEGKGHTWQTILDRWEMAMRTSPVRKLDPVTIQDHLAMLRRWTQIWLTRPASELNKGDARTIFDLMEAAGKSKSFQGKVKSTINQVYNWGIEQRLIKGVFDTPVVGVQIKKDEEKLPEILNLEQIRTLLFQAKRLEHPWFPIWAAAVLTGMRSGELHALLWADVDMENRKILMSKSYNTRKRLVKCPKAGYWRNVPVSTQLHELFIELKRKTGNTPHVFPRFRDWDKGEQARVLRTFCQGMGLPSVKFHTLRACFGTQLIAHGIPTAQIMKVAGWKDLKTMQRYIRLAGVEEKGATECLKVLAADAEVMGTVVNFLDFKAKQGGSA